MNEIKFAAFTVNCYMENDVLIIGIGNDKIAPDNYLIISRFDDGSADDSIGIQTHLTEMQISNSIKSVTLNDNYLMTEIKSDKIIDVQARKIIIELKSNEVNYDLLVKYIRDIFEGSSVKVTIAYDLIY